MAFGPAHDLAHAHRPAFRNLFVTLRAVLVNGFPPGKKQAEGKIGVLGQSVFVPPADLFQRGCANAGHGPAVLRDEMQIHAGLLVYLIPAGTLKIQ